MVKALWVLGDLSLFPPQQQLQQQLHWRYVSASNGSDINHHREQR
jgi:hypothetical protein